MQREIVVAGSAERLVAPDRATVGVTVEADGADNEAAYRSAAAIASGVDAVLAARSAAMARTTTAALTVSPITRWHEGEQRRVGWRAGRHTSLELTRFDGLTDLLGELAVVGAGLRGPTWQVDPANPAHDTVRSAAAADARRRAEAYAAGLGLVIGDVLWLAEPGLRSGGAVGAPPMAAMRMTAAAGMDESESIVVHPEEIAVTARVEVAFALAPGVRTTD